MVNGQIVESFTLRSIDTSVQGQGYVTSPGSIEGAATDTIAATWDLADAFSSVGVDIPLSGLQVGVGVTGPYQDAFSSLALTATLVIPSESLSYPVFSGLVTGSQTSVSGPSFSASGDWANCFSVGPGAGPGGIAGTFDLCSSLDFSKTINLGMTLPADTALDLDVQLTAQGSASLATPEPSTWALMLAGFAGLLFAAFRRRDAFAAG